MSKVYYHFYCCSWRLSEEGNNWEWGFWILSVIYDTEWQSLQNDAYITCYRRISRSHTNWTAKINSRYRGTLPHIFLLQTFSDVRLDILKEHRSLPYSARLTIQLGLDWYQWWPCLSSLLFVTYDEHRLTADAFIFPVALVCSSTVPFFNFFISLSVL